MAVKQPVIISFLQVHILPAAIFDSPADVGLVFGCRGINHRAADFPLSKQSDFVAALRGCQRRLGNKYLAYQQTCGWSKHGKASQPG